MDSTSPRASMMEVRAAETHPHAQCHSPGQLSCDTQRTRPKRNYKRTKQATHGRRKTRRHAVHAWLRRAGACACRMRPPAAATHAQHVCAFCACRVSLVSYVCSSAWVGPVACRMRVVWDCACGWVSAARTSIMLAQGEVLSVCILCVRGWIGQ